MLQYKYDKAIAEAKKKTPGPAKDPKSRKGAESDKQNEDFNFKA